MKSEPIMKIRKFINRSGVGYFAPLIALARMANKRRWNFVRQMQVVYRYSFGSPHSRINAPRPQTIHLTLKK